MRRCGKPAETVNRASDASGAGPGSMMLDLLMLAILAGLSGVSFLYVAWLDRL